MPGSPRAPRTALSILAALAALTIAGCSGGGSGDGATISADVLAAQAAADLTAETGTATDVRCAEGVTLDADGAGERVCESRYADFDWSQILVVVDGYDPKTATFTTTFANPPD